MPIEPLHIPRSHTRCPYTGIVQGAMYYVIRNYVTEESLHGGLDSVCSAWYNKRDNRTGIVACHTLAKVLIIFNIYEARHVNMA